MNTISVLLSVVMNDHYVVHMAGCQANFIDCYQAAQTAIDQQDEASDLASINVPVAQSAK